MNNIQKYDIKNDKTPITFNSTFKKYNNEVIPDVIDYLKNYLYSQKEHELEIWCGCDSIKSTRNNAVYAIALCIYRKGNGGHIIYTKLKQNVNSIYDKLWKETELSLLFADFLIKNKFLTIKEGDKYYSASIVGKKIPFTLDLDYNIKEDTISSHLLQAGIGYCEQKNIYSRAKPVSWAATYFADIVCRGRNLINKNYKNKKNKKYNKKRNIITLNSAY